MARRKAKFKRKRRGLEVEHYLIRLTCYQCNLTKEIVRQNGEDPDVALDREAKGWYTILDGIALCPRHVIESGTNLRPLYPLSEKIHGDSQAHADALARYMERTRRRLERNSWISATSEDSTTSETS
jgi:hypothetical protein